ncbi:HD-GYP domain-containing protein [Thalassotalea fusca]
MPAQDIKHSIIKIPISQLRIGMYVVEIVSGKKSVTVKSEGYVLNNDAINRLEKSGVTHVSVDPDKDKNKPAQELPAVEVGNTAQVETPPAQFQPKVSLDHEMKTASKLYGNAKELQSKILNDIASGKMFDIESARLQTDAIVDSIFRNQDALACMARLRMKDEYLIEHSLNVSILTTIFAKHLGEKREVIEQLALGAFLHDIGKIRIPDAILHKPARLTDKEYQQMQRHVQLGVELLEESAHLSHIAISMVKEHHERLDGNGYPLQLTDKQISKYGRVIAIVDSYDAMTADRVYKSGMHPINAFKNLKQCVDSSYDKALVESFIQCLGLYPVGTLVKLDSGKLGLISRLNSAKPLKPFVKVFYNTRMSQAIPIEEIDLSSSKARDQIECSIRPEEFNINLLGFFKTAFID